MLEVFTNVLGSSIGKIFLVDIGIQWVGWAFAVYFKTEKFYDLTGKKLRIFIKTPSQLEHLRLKLDNQVGHGYLFS